MSYLPSRFKPNPTSHDFVEQVLAANVVLTEASPTVHYLDAGVDPWRVTLPTPSSLAPYFRIYNTSESFGCLFVVDHNGFLASVIPPGKTDAFFCNASDEWVSELNGYIGAYLDAMQYGCNTSAANQNFRANGNAVNAALGGGNEDQPAAAFVVPFDGLVPMASWVTTGTSSRQTGIYLRDVQRTAVEWSSTDLGIWGKKIDPVLSFEANEYVALKKNNFPAGDATAVVFIKQRNGPTQFGASVGFGADLNTTTNFARANGTAATTEVSGAAVERTHPMPRAGNAIFLSWHVASSGGTVRVHNLTTATTTDVVLSTTRNSSSISLAFSAGDILGIEYLSGTAPGLSNFRIYTDLPGYILSWGGDDTGSAGYYKSCGEATDSTAAATGTGDKIGIPEITTLTAIAWSVETAGADRTLALQDNFNTLATQAISTTEGAADFAPNATREGRYVTARSTDTNRVGKTIVNGFFGAPAA